MLLRQPIRFPASWADPSAGRSMPARIPMMAMTTSSSMSVKAGPFLFGILRVAVIHPSQTSKGLRLLPEHSTRRPHFTRLLRVAARAEVSILRQHEEHVYGIDGLSPLQIARAAVGKGVVGAAVVAALFSGSAGVPLVV